MKSLDQLHGIQFTIDVSFVNNIIHITNIIHACELQCHPRDPFACKIVARIQSIANYHMMKEGSYTHHVLYQEAYQKEIWHFVILVRTP